MPRVDTVRPCMSNKTVSVELIETTKQLAEVQEANKSLGQDIVSLRDQLATANKAIEDGKTELANIQTDLANTRKTRADIEAEVARLKTALEASEKSASAKAAEIVASQGCPPVAGLNVPLADSPADLMAQFARISDPKLKTEFYRKNKAVLDPTNK